MPTSHKSSELPTRVSKACIDCDNYSVASSFEANMRDHRTTTLIIMVSISTILITIFLILLVQNPIHAWELVNMIITSIFATFILLYGKFDINKKLTMLVFLVNLAYMIVFYSITNFVFINFVTWSEFYQYFDQIAHFNMGWILYHAFRSLMPNKHMAWSVLVAIGFELVYELIEYTYGYIFNMWIFYDLNELINFAQDLTANTFGSLFGLLIEYIFFYQKPIMKK